MGFWALVWAISGGKCVAGDVFDIVPEDKGVSDFDKNADYSYVFHFPDASYAKARQLLEPSLRPAVSGDPEFEAHDLEDRFVKLHKKRWRVNVDQLTLSTSKVHFQMGTNIDSYLECKEGVKAFSTTDKLSRSLELIEFYK